VIATCRHVGYSEVSARTVAKYDVSFGSHGLAQLRSEAVRQQFYAISVERKIKHPAVVAICEAARQDIFSKKIVSPRS